MATITLSAPVDFRLKRVNGNPCLEFETREGDEITLFFGSNEELEELCDVATGPCDAVVAHPLCPDMIHEDDVRMAADHRAEQEEAQQLRDHHDRPTEA